MISITVSGATYSYNASNDQLAGLGHARSTAMAMLPDPAPLPGRNSDETTTSTPIEQRPGYIADDVLYLQDTINKWATKNSEATPTSIPICIDRALNSWLLPKPPPPAVVIV